MNKFETLDNLNTNFVTLSENELMELEGGLLDPFSLGLIAGGVITVGAAIWSIVKKNKNLRGGSYD